MNPKLVCAGIAVLLGACSDNVRNGYIISTSTRGISAVGYAATDSNYRLVVAATQVDPRNPEGPKRMTLCAESAPDTSIAASSAMSAAIAAKVNAAPGSPVNPEGSVSAARNYAEAVAALIGRSQGLAMYRDGMYALCQAEMNGALSPGEFYRASDNLRQTSAELIALEIKTGLPQRPQPASGPSVTNPTLTVIKP